MSPRARDIKERINKGDINKIKSFFMAKENCSKREPTMWENIFANGFYLPNIQRTHTTPQHEDKQSNKEMGK